MASPLKARSAKARANLKRGGQPGRSKGAAREREVEVRRISRKLLEDPVYQKNLKERLQTGRIQPGVEAMLWYYGYGKPPETVEQKVVIPVRIQHQYQE